MSEVALSPKNTIPQGARPAYRGIRAPWGPFSSPHHLLLLELGLGDTPAPIKSDLLAVHGFDPAVQKEGDPVRHFLSIGDATVRNLARDPLKLGFLPNP